MITPMFHLEYLRKEKMFIIIGRINIGSILILKNSLKFMNMIINVSSMFVSYFLLARVNLICYAVYIYVLELKVVNILYSIQATRFLNDLWYL